ncbi:MAG TPA: type II toxin-antitoxin system HicA family toxin [Bacteroidota bacterium]
MPKKVPPLSSKEFVRLLERGGARFVRQRRTDHAIYERMTATGELKRAPVIMGKRELTPAYQKLVLRQLGFTVQEIDNLIE